MKRLLLSLGALLSVVLVNAQTADEIISKYLDAVGGKENLAKVTSVYIESGTEVMGNESATKTTILNGKGYRNESNFNGQQLVNVITDKGGWAINPFGGSDQATAMPAEQYKSVEGQIYVDPFLNYAAKGSKVELLGKEKVGSADAYKIKYTNKDNAETIYYIDPTTYYIVQSVKKGNAMGQEVTINVSYSDYKKNEGGFYYPYTTNIDMGQFALKVNAKKVEVNKPVDASIFEMPKK
ncbi:MAG: outer membrane lipoprotein-sorting protein [Bacteroidota bacterium]|nr:outer membrane lipoprotein-sorting protein [Bacteroidota bacterium]